MNEVEKEWYLKGWNFGVRTVQKDGPTYVRIHLESCKQDALKENGITSNFKKGLADSLTSAFGA